MCSGSRVWTRRWRSGWTTSVACPQWSRSAPRRTSSHRGTDPAGALRTHTGNDVIEVFVHARGLFVCVRVCTDLMCHGECCMKAVVLNDGTAPLWRTYGAYVSHAESVTRVMTAQILKTHTLNHQYQFKLSDCVSVCVCDDASTPFQDLYCHLYLT